MNLPAEMVTSFANPTVKRFKALSARKNRRREGAFTVEGLQPVWYAVEAARTGSGSPWQVDTLIVAPQLLGNSRSQEMVAEVAEGGTARILTVSDEVFGHLSDRDGPAGLAAIIRGKVGDLHGLAALPDGPIIALKDVANPGNIGTILRSADAGGAAALVLVGQCADPLAPQAVKASMGSVFAVPLAEAADIRELLDWAAVGARPVAAITGHTDRSLWDAELADRAVLLFGSEGDGLPEDVVAQCEAAYRIPMSGTAESLNLATAASIAIFELSRRRHGENRI